MAQRHALNEVLADPSSVRELAPGLYDALPEDAAAAPYDRKAAIYDAVVGLSAYQRIFWGTSAASFDAFARRAIETAGQRNFMEAGCGSLLFTSSLYVQRPATFALLVDRSMQMLRRGLKRLSSGGDGPPETVAALHSDIASIPVRSGIFERWRIADALHRFTEPLAYGAAQAADRRNHIVSGRRRLVDRGDHFSVLWRDKLGRQQVATTRLEQASLHDHRHALALRELAGDNSLDVRTRRALHPL